MLRQLTVEQFLAEREELPHSGRWAELVEGIPICFEPPDLEHGNVILNLSKSLADFIQRTSLGYACFDLGLLLTRDPDTLRFPAVSYFLTGERFAESDKLYTEALPSFVIELASSADRRRLMQTREREFLQRGVELVWTIDTQSRSVSVLSSRGARAAQFAEGQRVAGAPLLEGFEVQVSDLFAEPSWWRA